MVLTNGRVAPSPRFQEVREGLALRERLLARIAELEKADRETEVRLITIRTMLAELRELLAQAERASALPTPYREELR